MEPDVFSHICFLLSSCEIKRECNCRSGPKYCTTLYPVTLVPVTVPVTLNPVTLDPTPVPLTDQGNIPMLFILKVSKRN